MISEHCHLLPERHGVYYFYDKNNALLYVGKSINIRKRVLSHYYNAEETKRHAKMISQIAFIKYKCTAGELGALLLESAEIKKLQPLYNRRLRQFKHLFSWVLSNDLKPELKQLDVINDNQISVGLYQSRHKASYWLKNLIEKKQLCSKVLGLEKTTRSCFNYQIKKCLGACCGKEPIANHNERLIKAFEESSVISWPWKGAIAIHEADHLYNLKHWHIINQWRYIKTIEKLDTDIEQSLPPFSKDDYQIFIRFLRYNNPEIIELTTKELLV